MKPPKISIIVPIHNMANSLPRTIESILNQTYSDYEILLIDDGSTDRSGEICDSYAYINSKIRAFHKPNGGLSSTRNYGIDNARGTWITFCDADDYVATTWLENYHLEENTDKTIICQGLTKFWQKGEDIELVQEYRGSCEGNVSNVLSTLYHIGMLGWTPIKAYKLKTILERGVRFDVKHKYREDEKFIMEFLRPDDKLILYDTVGYFYQISDASKYDDWKCTPEFSKSIYDNAVRLGSEPGSEFRNHFANEYKDTLLRCLKAGNADNKTLTNELKRLIRQEYNRIGLFPLTKFMLRYDKTGVLSYPILRLHLALKSN